MTNADTNKRSRSWCFTTNNPSSADSACLEPLKRGGALYAIIGRERGAENTPHLQGFVQFKDGKSLTAVKRILPRSHLERKCAKSTFEQAIAYCKKDGDFEEIGELPQDPGDKGRAESERWDLARTLARSGDLDQIESRIFIQYYNTLKRIAQDNRSNPEDLPEPAAVWLWGLSGCGKSYEAHHTFPKERVYIKDLTKWWDGYEDQEVVIIEDMDVYSREFTRCLKIWADQYAFPAEVKGGSKIIRPKLIIVTSQYTIEKIWQDCLESRQALLRRFVVLNKLQRDVRLLTGYSNMFGDLASGLGDGIEHVAQVEEVIEWENLINYFN